MEVGESHKIPFKVDQGSSAVSLRVRSAGSTHQEAGAPDLPRAHGIPSCHYTRDWEAARGPSCGAGLLAALDSS